MVLELVEEKDCVGGKGYINKGRNGICTTRERGMLKRITNRDRKRCYNCGYDGGVWYEYLDRGRRIYHFLCQDCINTIENIK